MRITILTVGSLGDVQPYVALGVGLQKRGHQVCIAAHAEFQSLVEGHGVDFASVAGDPRRSIAEEVGQSWLESGSNPAAFVRRMLTIAQPLMQQLLADYWNASRDADLILYPVIASLAATTLGELLNIPVIPAYLQHVHPTGRYPFALMRPRNHWAGWPNRLTHAIAEPVFWAFARRYVNRWRTDEWGLDPYPLASPFMDLLRQRPCCLYGFSSHVVPKPPEWDDNVYLTGYWFLDAPSDWQPPSSLLDFLDAGPPPVYIGFGSMAAREPAAMTEIALDALQRTGRRGLLLTGWGGLSNRDLPDHVYKLDAAPHDWLFPRMAAVVHHGGCGTTAAGLRAGVPTVVVPFFADQPFWGWRVAQLGVGPQPIPRKALSAARLAAAITATDDVSLRARAAALGETIRGEAGVDCAVAAIERHIERNLHPL